MGRHFGGRRGGCRRALGIWPVRGGRFPGHAAPLSAGRGELVRGAGQCGVTSPAGALVKLEAAPGLFPPPAAHGRTSAAARVDLGLPLALAPGKRGHSGARSAPLWWFGSR